MHLTKDNPLNNSTTSGGQAPHYAGSETLGMLSEWYTGWHGYIACLVCLLGIVANGLNIVILTRKKMISATNCLLSALAVTDCLTMAAYLPFALRFYVLYGTELNPVRNSYGAAWFMLVYACFSVVLHTVSIWLTVSLATFRFVFVTYPRYGVDWCSLYRAKLTVCLVVIVTVIVCIPNFITVTVKSYDDQKIDRPPRGQREITNRTADRWNASWDLGFTGSGNEIDGEDVVWLVTFKSQSSAEIAMKSFNFWIQAILVKLVPCIGLTILSLLLVKTMRESNKQRQLLKQKRANTTDPVFSLDTAAAGNEVRLLPEKPEAADHRDRATDRTTRLLLCVVILFLLTEFPQGILTLLGGILSEAFVDEIYIPLGDLFDIAVLINSGVNFVLYCTMSEQFRETFAQVFLSRCRCRNDGHDKINNGSDSSHLSTSKKTRTTSH